MTGRQVVRNHNTINDLEVKNSQQKFIEGLQWLFLSQDLISNSPYCLPYNIYDLSLENLVLDQLRIGTFFKNFFICVLDIGRENSVLVTLGS